MHHYLYDSLMIVLLVLGFGFVVFFHELGHFLAAKWMGIKVEQFAVGFGHAMISWRKGMGFCWGSSRKRYEELVAAQKEGKGFPQLLGETEYRLNYLPLGGYVKMLGQDDLKPGADSDDPGAYNRKSVGARMVVVSAGVIMNVILAAIGFMVLFLIGFKAPSPTVGAVQINSPAERAGILPGDTILYIDGKWQYDFSKIGLTIALLPEGAQVPFAISRPGLKDPITLMVRPEQPDKQPHALLGVGMSPGYTLKGPSLENKEDWKKLQPGENPEADILQPGDVITAIDGHPVEADDYYLLNRALQAGDGRAVPVTITDADLKRRQVDVQPHFETMFDSTPLNFGGLQPRVAVQSINEDSSALHKLEPGDAIYEASVADLKQNPSAEEFLKLVKAAADQGKNITLTVVRDGKNIAVPDLSASAKLDQGGRGLGIAMMADEQHAVTADPIKDSAADRAGIKGGELITAVDGHPVKNWFDVRAFLQADGLDKNRPTEHTISIAGKEKSCTMMLSPTELQLIRDVRYDTLLDLQIRQTTRQTHNPLTAALWGAGETRDFILQFYVTIHRMLQGSVSVKNMMGPVGIVVTGSRLAFAGFDKLLWFLSMISANLAVVNFLPIPVVDGGLFTFLILEKIQGRPLSQKAQVAWQIVGLTLIIGVFLLVTYQDIINHVLR